MSLLGTISGEDMRAVQIVTGVTMAAFIGVGLAPRLHRYATRIRFGLLVAYLLVCFVLVGAVLVR